MVVGPEHNEYTRHFTPFLPSSQGNVESHRLGVPNPATPAMIPTMGAHSVRTAVIHWVGQQHVTYGTLPILHREHSMGWRGILGSAYLSLLSGLWQQGLWQEKRQFGLEKCRYLAPVTRWALAWNNY